MCSRSGTSCSLYNNYYELDFSRNINLNVHMINPAPQYKATVHCERVSDHIMTAVSMWVGGCHYSLCHY